MKTLLDPTRIAKERLVRLHSRTGAVRSLAALLLSLVEIHGSRVRPLSSDPPPPGQSFAHRLLFGRTADAVRSLADPESFPDRWMLTRCRFISFFPTVGRVLTARRMFHRATMPHALASRYGVKTRPTAPTPRTTMKPMKKPKAWSQPQTRHHVPADDRARTWSGKTADSKVRNEGRYLAARERSAGTQHAYQATIAKTKNPVSHA
jgi:hypothetical protein